MDNLGIAAITGPISRAVGQELIVWAQVTVTLCIVGELAFIEVTLLVIGASIAHHAEDVSFLQPLADRWREVAGVQGNGQRCQRKAFALAVQSFKVR